MCPRPDKSKRMLKERHITFDVSSTWLSNFDTDIVRDKVFVPEDIHKRLHARDLVFVHSLLDEQTQILFLPLRPYFFGYPSMFRYHKSVWKFVITTNEEFVYKDYKHNQLNSFEMNQQALRFSSDQSQTTPCPFSVSVLHNLQLTFFFLPHCKTRRDPCQYSSISDLILRPLETWEKLGWILP